MLTETSSFFEKMLDLLNDTLIPLVFSLALLVFFWGIVKYIRSEGQGKEEGKKIMIWGVIALFVMSSIWALVFFISGELGVQNYEPGSGSMAVPTISY